MYAPSHQEDCVTYRAHDESVTLRVNREDLVGAGDRGRVYATCEEGGGELKQCPYVAKLQDTGDAPDAFVREATMAKHFADAGLGPKFITAYWCTIDGRPTGVIVTGRLAYTVYDIGLRLPKKQYKELTQRVLDLVKRMHRAGLVHYDLHLNNIMVDENGRPKFVDLSQARFVDPRNPTDARFVQSERKETPSRLKELGFLREAMYDVFTSDEKYAAERSSDMYRSVLRGLRGRAQ